MERKRILWFCSGIVVLIAALMGCAAKENGRREMPLEKYSYVREEFRASDLEYLVGNAEMGGMTDNRGWGLEKTWFTDVWKNKEWRKSLPGLLIQNEQYSRKQFHQAKFRHELNIKTGIQQTSVRFPDGSGYETVLFFSKINKHLMVLSVKNTSKNRQQPDVWNLTIPKRGFVVARVNASQLQGQMVGTKQFTRIFWTLKCSKGIREEDGNYEFSLAPGEQATLLYSVTTHWDGDDYREQALAAVNVDADIQSLVQQQKQAWERQWRSVASVILPPGEYAKWFYRSIALLYWTSGADRFCAGEKQFAIPDPDWHMHPFTYGHGGGWSVWAFARLGDRRRAMNIAMWHYNPKALHENVKILFPRLGPVKMTYRGRDIGVHTYLQRYNPNAIAFGHEVDTDGHNITYKGDYHWDLQRHIDGFAGAFYDLLDRFYPDSSFTQSVTYPVLRGTAEMYASLAKWDAQREIYIFPPLLSVSENIMEKSVLDVVLAAKWTFKNAILYAKRLNRDPQLQKKWQRIYDHLYVPQNDSTYLEYLDDTQKRKGGGYFGIRAFSYLGFPLLNRIEDIDRKKARNALDRCWERNHRGEGMITFILNWFALTEAYLGNGEKAHEISRLVPTIQDSSGTCLVEVIARDRRTGRERRINKYFLTGNTSFILVPLAMILQSYDHKIRPFPAVPSEWPFVEFYDLPAEEGITVSGKYRDGQTEWVSFKKDGKELLRLGDNSTVEIRAKGKTLKLVVVDKE